MGARGPQEQILSQPTFAATGSRLNFEESDWRLNFQPTQFCIRQRAEISAGSLLSWLQRSAGSQLPREAEPAVQRQAG